MQRSGEYFAAEDVFRYVTARAEGKPARRPNRSVGANRRSLGARVDDFERVFEFYADE